MGRPMVDKTITWTVADHIAAAVRDEQPTLTAVELAARLREMGIESEWARTVIPS